VNIKFHLEALLRWINVNIKFDILSFDAFDRLID